MMKKPEASRFENPKIITKRRIVNNKKEYLVGDKKTGLCSWKQQSRSIMQQAQAYDEAHKDILPYFPNDKVKIYYEAKYLQIDYNGKPVTMESSLTKKARVEILNELNKMIPVQIFEAMYHQGKEVKKTVNMLREIFEQEQEK